MGLRDLEVPPAPPPPPPRDSAWALRTCGIACIALGVLGTPTAALFALLSTNACGPFADGCDDYGQTADGFEFFVGATFVCAIVFVVGVVLVVRNRHR